MKKTTCKLSIALALVLSVSSLSADTTPQGGGCSNNKAALEQAFNDFKQSISSLMNFYNNDRENKTPFTPLSKNDTERLKLMLQYAPLYEHQEKLSKLLEKESDQVKQEYLTKVKNLFELQKGAEATQIQEYIKKQSSVEVEITTVKNALDSYHTDENGNFNGYQGFSEYSNESFLNKIKEGHLKTKQDDKDKLEAGIKKNLR